MVCLFLHTHLVMAEHTLVLSYVTVWHVGTNTNIIDREGSNSCQNLVDC